MISPSLPKPKRNPDLTPAREGERDAGNERDARLEPEFVAKYIHAAFGSSDHPIALVLVVVRQARAVVLVQVLSSCRNQLVVAELCQHAGVAWLVDPDNVLPVAQVVGHRGVVAMKVLYLEQDIVARGKILAGFFLAGFLLAGLRRPRDRFCF